MCHQIWDMNALSKYMKIEVCSVINNANYLTQNNVNVTLLIVFQWKNLKYAIKLIFAVVPHNSSTYFLGLHICKVNAAGDSLLWFLFLDYEKKIQNVF